MAISTALPSRAEPRTHRRWQRARTALARAQPRATRMVSAARHHDWSPALTISGLGCVDAAFYQLNLFGGLLATGISILLYDWSRGDT